ncbi:precorrin-3B synthase [Nonomuraea sp. 3N208]|uniref:precorrin-3B synthase n=1 Tax=Nonomuraea sp. 3N208 TaxID=3457421 RepID=UPI003FD03977
MSIADFSGRLRPDACPGALQVHEAADGPLARVRLPGGAISPGRLRELAGCAEDLGSGVIELTSRANVQVRGLRSPAAFAERIAAAGLLPSAAHERVRNIVASPLGGRTGFLDPQPLVDALDRALCARPRLAGLPGRFLFAVDDGTGDMLALGADVTFFDGRLLLAGVDAGLAASPDTAAERMIAAAEAFLDERETSGGDQAAWRIAELANGPARIAARLRATPRPLSRSNSDSGAASAAGTASDATVDSDAVVTTVAPVTPVAAVASVASASSQRAGRVEQRDGRVALAAVVPLGRLSAAQARAIAEAAEVNDAAGAEGTTGGAVPVRLTPWRTVVLLDLERAAADRATRVLEAAGLVTDPASPWAGVSACTGRPGCAKSLADVQEDARRWVATLDGTPAMPVHWSGCERRCGLPRGRVVQMIATDDGYQERQ